MNEIQEQAFEEYVGKLVSTFNLAGEEHRVRSIVSSTTDFIRIPATSITKERVLRASRPSLWAALEVLQPDKALCLFEAPDLEPLRQAELLAESLHVSEIHVGGDSLAELTSAIYDFMDCFVDNRYHLLATGYPLVLPKPMPSPILIPQTLYCTKYVEPDIDTETLADQITYRYFWTTNDSGPANDMAAILHEYENASRLSGLSDVDAWRIEEDRPRLWRLVYQVLSAKSVFSALLQKLETIP